MKTAEGAVDAAQNEAEAAELPATQFSFHAQAPTLPVVLPLRAHELEASETVQGSMDVVTAEKAAEAMQSDITQGSTTGGVNVDAGDQGSEHVRVAITPEDETLLIGEGQSRESIQDVKHVIDQAIAKRGGEVKAGGITDGDVRRTSRKKAKKERIAAKKLSARVQPAAVRVQNGVLNNGPARPSTKVRRKSREATRLKTRQRAARHNPVEYRQQLEQKLAALIDMHVKPGQQSRRSVKRGRRQERIACKELKAFDMELAAAAQEGALVPGVPVQA